MAWLSGVFLLLTLSVKVHALLAFVVLHPLHLFIPKKTNKDLPTEMKPGSLVVWIPVENVQVVNKKDDIFKVKLHPITYQQLLYVRSPLCMYAD